MNESRKTLGEQRRTTKTEELNQKAEEINGSERERTMSGAIRTILMARTAPGSSIPIAPETTEWRTQAVRLHGQSPMEDFLAGSSQESRASMLDIITVAYGSY